MYSPVLRYSVVQIVTDDWNLLVVHTRREVKPLLWGSRCADQGPKKAYVINGSSRHQTLEFDLASTAHLSPHITTRTHSVLQTRTTRRRRRRHALNDDRHTAWSATSDNPYSPTSAVKNQQREKTPCARCTMSRLLAVDLTIFLEPPVS